MRLAARESDSFVTDVVSLVSTPVEIAAKYVAVTLPRDEPNASDNVEQQSCLEHSAHYAGA